MRRVTDAAHAEAAFLMERRAFPAARLEGLPLALRHGTAIACRASNILPPKKINGVLLYAGCLPVEDTRHPGLINDRLVYTIPID